MWTVEHREADIAVVLVIMEPTDIWETARWMGGAGIEAPSWRLSG